MVEPIPTNPVIAKAQTAQKAVSAQQTTIWWTVWAFAIASAIAAALFAWQLQETTPGRWCGLAAATSPEGANACLTILAKLLDIKHDILRGLLILNAINVVSLVVVVLKVKVNLSGPAGIDLNVAGDVVTVVPERKESEQ